MATCLVCAEAWDLAQELREPEASPIRAVPTSSAPWPGTRSSWLPLAASLLLILGTGLWITRTPDPPVDRSPDSPAITSQVSGTLLRTDCTLHWQGPPEATSYEVRVSWITSETRTTITEKQQLEESSLTIPPKDLEGIPPGARLLWHIEARKDGRTLAAHTVSTQLE